MNHLRHELHTPLNHIIGYSELLLESVTEGSTAALEPGLRQLHEFAQQLLLLVDQVLGRSRKDDEIDLHRLSAQASGPISSVIAAAQELKIKAEQMCLEGADQDLERIASAARALHAESTRRSRCRSSSRIRCELR